MPKGIYKETGLPFNHGFKNGHSKIEGCGLKKGMFPKNNIWNKSEEESFTWKGENACKKAMHLWVNKWKGKPLICEVCGTESAKKYCWANVDHSYNRNLDDYVRMCNSCHLIYDRN